MQEHYGILLSAEQPSLSVSCSPPVLPVIVH
jgi:hypothetical protein